MKRLFKNKFRAYQNTIGVLDEQSGVYGDYPLAVAAVEEFRDLLNQIKIIGERTDLDYGDLTSKKQRVKHEMAEVISSMAAVVSIYAKDTDDPDLEAVSSVTYTDVRRSSDFESLEMARGLQAAVLNNREALGGYMVSDEDVNEITRIVAEFDEIFVTREEVQSESVLDTQRLEMLFRKSDNILREKLDKVVKKLKLENEEFYNSYFQARMIVDL